MTVILPLVLNTTTNETSNVTIGPLTLNDTEDEYNDVVTIPTNGSHVEITPLVLDIGDKENPEVLIANTTDDEGTITINTLPLILNATEEEDKKPNPTFEIKVNETKPEKLIEPMTLNLTSIKGTEDLITDETSPILEIKNEDGDVTLGKLTIEDSDSDVATIHPLNLNLTAIEDADA